MQSHNTSNAPSQLAKRLAPAKCADKQCLSVAEAKAKREPFVSAPPRGEFIRTGQYPRVQAHPTNVLVCKVRHYLIESHRPDQSRIRLAKQCPMPSLPHARNHLPPQPCETRSSPKILLGGWLARHHSFHAPENPG